MCLSAVWGGFSLILAAKCTLGGLQRPPEWVEMGQKWSKSDFFHVFSNPAAKCSLNLLKSDFFVIFRHFPVPPPGMCES